MCSHVPIHIYIYEHAHTYVHRYTPTYIHIETLQCHVTGLCYKNEITVKKNKVYKTYFLETQNISKYIGLVFYLR